MNPTRSLSSLPETAGRFPPGFLWGTSSSAYQVEGAVSEDGRGISIWDTFARVPGNVNRGDNADVTCDEYHRLDQNLDLMAEFGLNAYRFSIAWPRIQPDGTGRPNRRGLDYYRRLVDGLHKRDMIPLVTLYHWDLPQALEDKGGWTVRDTSHRFADYAAVVFEELGASVPYWTTLNEPWCQAWAGYGGSGHAPGRSSDQDALAATHHLLLGHGLALEAMRSIPSGGAQLGITHCLFSIRSYSEDADDGAAARRVDGVSNRMYLDPIFRGTYPRDVVEWFGPDKFSFIQDGDLERIGRPIDFLGLNYYMRHTVADGTGIGAIHDFACVNARTLIPAGVPTTSFGWPIQPEGLTELLERLKAEYVGTETPIIVTENGCAADDYVDPEGEIRDDERISYLADHIAAIADAIDNGVDVRGYTPWSFLDNFEWAAGFSKRFGMVYVDYSTQTRIPKRSASWYRDHIRRYQEHTARREQTRVPTRI